MLQVFRTQVEVCQYTCVFEYMRICGHTCVYKVVCGSSCGVIDFITLPLSFLR